MSVVKLMVSKSWRAEWYNDMKGAADELLGAAGQQAPFLAEACMHAWL
jgi:hypothetical protein